MRLLFLACLSPQTGNCTTAERIRDHIERAGHVCLLRDTRDVRCASDVAHLQRETALDGALAIHLYKAGRLLLDAGVPFGVVFGGTDINEDAKDEGKRAVMKEVLNRARFAVSFSKELKEKAEAILECGSGQICVQAQGIETRPSLDFSWMEFLRSAGVCVDGVEDLKVFLLVCGLRRVKDPLYLLNAFSEWHTQNPLAILIIIGPKMDLEFSTEVQKCVERSAGVFLAAERSQEELHAAMQRSLAVVNSSQSEGMSAAVLEAMDLGVPVLARNIPGNAAIVRHGITGLLFSCPEEFVCLSKQLLHDKELRASLGRNGTRYVTQHHSAALERTTYQRLVATLH
ncbi:glycosyltransferase 1 domain-containing protein 1 [Electrophorus electricus]|uniref:Glycosyl transferase family 1 domain-containing protein n=1 Tax=Electrophorus electricus TaxID=8005 RepID=A0A4W4EVV6_ELEEL|nr:glycosyltransferase 1 domain-containing protein 1 [Electrophorus electricus]XP_026887904.2 glycosyltransferase 1 domain-containing protein 1 [Electrophorus electricus]XP_026887905.2 glycosyltransferase 1 domain-containing protein 1 [Electrophorus electricus]XP_035391934.1 glycosyltransferase 1 domain-containing protein 1 [Electrophorus electricus]